MACHVGGVRLQVFWSNVSFYMLLMSPLFFNMVDAADFCGLEL